MRHGHDTARAEDGGGPEQERPAAVHVWEAVLRPMLDTYMAPEQVRRDPRVRERALTEYVRTLNGFDRDTLARAWEVVRASHELSIWPSPGVIARACRQCQRAATVLTTEETPRQQALAMAEAYSREYFKTSHLARQARREGWGSLLRQYVDAAAWVQAQLICGCTDIGWDPHTLLPDAQEYRSSAEAFAAYRPTMQKTAERGRVSVRIPPARIRQWREECGCVSRSGTRDAGENGPTAQR